MTTLTTIELTKSYLEFSAGHFTMFSATHREKLHGHNFNVHAEFITEIQDHGISFDYMIYKKKLQALCQQLNGYFLLAGNSPHLRIEEQAEVYIGHFNGEKLYFPKSDVVILPLPNITIEELAAWFLQQLVTEKQDLDQYRIHKIKIKIYSAPGQCALAKWSRLSQ
jgi:6-pyruvoyltetrahydropterin/6-carboxytetrahydropterin synthase